MWLAAGSVPELGDDGFVYDTALVFNPRGELVARHRKVHLYPPTREPTVFTPGDRLTTFEDPALEKAIHKLAERVPYAIAGHDVVLHGRCPDCQKR